MSRWNLAWLLAVPALVALGLAASFSAPPPDKDYQLVRTIVDVLAEVDRNYVRELTDDEKKKLVEEMINGGLERLDPHSQYFNEEELTAFETQSEGQFGGVGILLTKDAKTPYLKVEAPMPGTPAYEAGIQANDLILKVKFEGGEKSTENLRIDEVRKFIIGPAGTQVTLTIVHDGATKEEDVTLTRAIIVQHPVQGIARDAADPTKWDFMADKENKIAYVRLTGFSEQSDKELRAAVEQAEKDGARGLILDLRDNPGGLLNQAVAISDLFLKEGTIVSTRDRNGGGRKWVAKPENTLFEPADKKPIVVLVNRNSASASEIVASALQDNKRAVVIGERSYGKGSVQKVFNMPNRKAAVKLTTETWLTPAGKNIHRWPDSKETDEWGVKPEQGFEVKLTDDQRREYFTHLLSLDRVRGKPGAKDGNSKDKPEQPKAAKPYKDPVMEKALDYLRGKVKEVGAVGVVERSVAA
ncbi:S41 family peptidase [Fimbriiglobus ruber]|uniref:Carboxyl-terminal protease n=1 Tax=Fimbriiglobus ruber TaxID=1908690 RepID=A0A225DGM6_9BACT|nr:S41 family peptidase [Fimbriiglobus ruber]OWK40602.1 Carboxyl-terminal protease [Fimbriiglobus ruber]